MGRKPKRWYHRFLAKLGFKTYNIYEFSEEEQRLSIIKRQKKAELAIRKTELEIAKLEAEVRRAEARTPEEMLMDIFTGWAEKNVAGSLNPAAQSKINNTVQQTLKSPPYEELTDEEIRKSIARFDKKDIDAVKKLNNRQIKNLMAAHVGISGSNADKAIKILREEF